MTPWSNERRRRAMQSTLLRRTGSLPATNAPGLLELIATWAVECGYHRTSIGRQVWRTAVAQVCELQPDAIAVEYHPARHLFAIRAYDRQ